MKKVTVKQDAEDVVEVPVLARAIVEISASMKKLTASGLNRKAIIVLIADSTYIKSGYNTQHPTKATVSAILEGLEDLAKTYTTTKGEKR